MSSLLVLVATLAAPPLLDASVGPLPIDPAVAPDSVIGELLSSDAWLDADPTWAETSGRTISVWRFGERRVVRIVPQLDGVRVEGADRVLTLRGTQVERVSVGAPLVRSGSFALSQTQAVASAAAAHPASILRPAQAEQTRGLAVQRWLSRGDVVRATWRVRVPTLSLRDLRDLWIDAETGALLMSEPVARFQPTPEAPTAARAFMPAPDAAGVDVTDLVDVTVGDLLPAFTGGTLRGYHIETTNCCKKYSCTTGVPPCDVVDRVCEADDATGAGIADSTALIGLPADMLPAAIRGMFPGDTIWIETVLCTEKPKLTSRVPTGNDPAGWFETPVDVLRSVHAADGLATETDAFAELQAYHATWTYFSHVRSVLEDPTFCLTQNSMQCDANGDSVLDTGAPVLPFHISTNFLFPKAGMKDPTDLNALGAQVLPPPLGPGLGTDPTTPVIIDDYDRLDNAAFIPALEGGPIEIPPELAPLAAQFNRSYDSNLYFQGDRDFAYDGDVVAHEFTHAIVFSYVPTLRSSGHDAWGSHVEGGAMNEGWSDYFAASWTDDSATGEYSAVGITGGETGLRDADNSAVCPNTFIGEVHEDSLPWSGALWEARRAVEQSLGLAGVAQLDQLLLSTLAASDSAETMALQTERVLAAINAEASFDAGVKAAVEDAFATRRLDACERIWPLNSAQGADSFPNVKPVLLQPSPGEVGLTNLAPGVLQMRVELPPNTLLADISWTQGSGGFAGMAGGSESTILRVLANEGSPINWRYEGTLGDQAIAIDTAGNVLPFDVTDSATHADVGTPNTAGDAFANFRWQAENVDACNGRTLFVAFASVDDPVTMKNISVEVTPSILVCPDPPKGDPDSGCGCGASSSGFAMMAGLLFFVRRRRRR